MNEGITTTLINAVFGKAAIDGETVPQIGERVVLTSGDFTTAAIPDLLPIPTITATLNPDPVQVRSTATLTVQSNSTGALSVTPETLQCTVQQIDDTHFSVIGNEGAASGTDVNLTISQAVTADYRATSIIKVITVQGFSYNISVSVTNGSYSGPSTIETLGVTNVYITPDSGYSFPSSISVTGATFIWNNDSGIVALSNPTDNVSITVVCV